MQGTAAHVRSASSLTDLKTSPKYSFELLLLLFYYCYYYCYYYYYYYYYYYLASPVKNAWVLFLCDCG